MDYMDAEAMVTLLTPKMEGTMPTIICEEPSDPPTFIIPTDGHSSIWTWVGFSKVIGKISYNASSNVFFNIFNKMNFDLAYLMCPIIFKFCS